MTESPESNTPSARPVVRRRVTAAETGIDAEEGGAIESAPSLSEGLASLPEKTWPTYTFTVPAGARVRDKDPKVITLRELDDELMKSVRRRTQDERDGAVETVKASLWMVDGKKVNHFESEADVYWSGWSSKVKHLCHLAWTHIHATTKDEDKSFLSSMVAG